MRVVDLIQKKVEGEGLTREELTFLLGGYVRGEVPDYQVAAFLMAVCFRGMTDEETVTLTGVMRDSGDIVDLSGIEGRTADKHSTGGVGDKTTLVLGPLLAACGLKVAKMSGRGLGHTGGTLDKLESVPGFRADIARAKFLDIVNGCGLAVIGQTADLVPADRLLYRLRDATATVNSIPLIASSIMSKKLAVKNDYLVLDVKVGSGAFMRTFEDASTLARAMVEIGKGFGRKVAALISDMDQPLGRAVGNALEVEEAVATLKGEGPPDLTDLVLSLGEEILRMSGLTPEGEERAHLEAKLRGGEALSKFEAMLEAQGAAPGGLERLPRADGTEVFESPADGTIQRIDCLEVGRAAMLLGAGRETKESSIDPSVGLVMKKRVGDAAGKGEPLCVLHFSHSRGTAAAREALARAFTLGADPVEPRPLIHERVR